MSSKAWALLLAVSMLAAEPHPGLHLFEEVEPHMGTLVQIKLYAGDAEQAKSATRQAFDRIAALDNILSDYQADSELNRLCRRTPGQPVQVSADLFHVLAASQRLAAETNGAFDVTVGPLTHLWREARRANHLPSAEALQEAAAHCGYRKLSLEASRQTATLAAAGMQLDVGAIGKGYAADEAIGVLRRLGIQSALVSVSGDLAFSDAPPGEAGWRIGVDSFDPKGASRQLVLCLKNGAASTSGDSEQHLEVGGTRYSHILNPLTGQALIQPMSVTVVAEKGIDADPEATALCVLGPEKGLQFIEQDTKSAALMAVKQETSTLVRASSRFKRLVAGTNAAPSF